MPKVFLSPSDQDNNPVAGGGVEQDYAVTRCLAAAQVLTGAGVQVRVSQAGTGDDSAGFLSSIAEGNAWGPDVYVADHTNATGVPGAVRSGIQVFAYLPDPASVALAHAVGKRLQPFIPTTPYRVMDGGHLGEVSSTEAPAILIEAGYHDNPADAEIIRTRTVEMGQAVGQGILDYLGIPAGAPAPVQQAPTPEQARPRINFPAFPWGLNSGHYLGDINGPAESHGGYYESERPLVRAVQQALIIGGYVPGISDPADGWADGIWEQPTTDALIRFQRDHMPHTQFYGQCWADDYAKLRELAG